MNKKLLANMFNLKRNCGFRLPELQKIIFIVTFLLSSLAKAQSPTTVTLTSGSSWTVPACVTSITIECWGAGGGGGFAGGTDGRSTGGGGGGAYAQVTTMAVTSGQAIPYSIGIGGTGTSGTNDGGDTWFFSVNDVLAKGGSGTANNSLTGGSGGQAAACVGDIVWNGGNGGSASSPDGGCSAGGGGGGGAGSGGNGNNGTNGANGSGGCLNGGNGGAGGAANGNGGTGGAGASNGTNTLATSGSTFGGGGGGGKRANIIGGDKAGGNGADGGIRITYTTTSPNVTISYASSAWCTSETAAQTPTITGTTGGTFSSSPAGLSINSTNGTITPGTSAAGTYTVTYSVNNGCGTSSTSTTVEITSSPAATISYGNTSFCTPYPVISWDDTIEILHPTITGISGGTFSASPSGLNISSTTGAITLGINAPANPTYTITYTTNSSCGTVTASTTITIKQSPNIQLSVWDVSCGATTRRLEVYTEPFFYATCNWGDNSESSNIWTGTLDIGASAHIVITADNGCSTAVDFTMPPGSTAAPTVTISEPESFCAGASTTLTASGGVTYLWSNNATTATTTVNTAGIYSVTATDANGCSGSATVTVTENPSPTITISGVPANFCDGDLTTLTANGGATYLWSDNSLTNTIDVSATGTYSVTGTDNNGCSASASASLSPQNPLGNINLPSSVNGCTGGEIILDATTDNATIYLWSNAESTASITITETGIYTVTASNECENKIASVSAEFEICECNFFLPTAFSPNNDGSNDTYQWEADCSSVQSFTMRIFNRWGESVFKTNDPKASWDGRFEGVLQPPGVYTVQVIASYQTGRKNKEKRKAGSFTLIR